MNAAAAHPLCGTARTLTGAAGPLLLPRFCAAASHLGTNLGFVRSQPGICHLTHICLVHQVYINGGFKNCRGEFHLAQFFTFQIHNIYFHD